MFKSKKLIFFYLFPKFSIAAQKVNNMMLILLLCKFTHQNIDNYGVKMARLPLILGLR